MNPHVIFYCDGGMLGSRNPSTIGVYWSVYCYLPSLGNDGSGSGEVVIRREESRQHFTNNDAEWLGLRAALQHAGQHYPGYSITIRSDSMLIVKQFSRTWRCKVARLHRLMTECHQLAAAFPEVWVEWRPRSELVKRLGH